MSKKYAREIVRQTSNPTNHWDTAIYDAERMIKESKEQIKRLKRAIESFRQLRDSGQPFPGDDVTQTKSDSQ